MIEATITLKLSKDHTVIRHHVTPVEALLLCAEHHKNVGDNPIEVHKETIKEIKQVRRETKLVKTGEKKEGDKTVDVMEEREVEVTGSRSDNDELTRLRTMYAAKKVQAIISSVKDLPKSFEEAWKLGVGIQTSSGGVATISETKLV